MNRHNSATLEWDSESPKSVHFNDFYFSTDDGLAETDYVFLKSNKLRERFSSLKHNTFTLAETGFGTGLNFLTTWLLWKSSSTNSSSLHFISAEKYPLSKNDLTRALSAWPQLKHEAGQLLTQYPELNSGFHQLRFDGGRVVLTLMFGDVVDCYRQLNVKVDAWFLDGFSPAKNPGMWTPELFQLMAYHSKSNTTFATFSCARVVRDGLTQAGFIINKKPGFGLKREMLSGTFSGTPMQTNNKEKTPSWFSLPPKHTSDKTALIIGAGVAGCSTARSLAQRGWKVTLVDRHSAIATEGSGNRQGALYAKLPVEPIPASRFHLSGFLYSSNFLKQNLADRPDIWSPCGLLQLASSEKERLKHRKLADSGNYPDSIVRFVEQDKASELAGITVNNSGLFFPEAGWATPPLLCKWLTEHPNITIKTSTHIAKLEHKENNWTAFTKENQTLSASIVVVASAADSTLLEQLKQLPVQKIRGQVSLTQSNIQAPPLNTVLCSQGYISPSKEGRFCFGATFDLKDEATDIRESGHQHNLTKIAEMAPELANTLQQYHTDNSLTGRVGFRCASPDKLPMIGAVPVYEAFVEDYAQLRHDAKKAIDTPPKHYPGLYANLAHGSKGLISGPISGEIIAAMLENEPLPIEKELIDILNPARFIIKNLIRRTI
ncbi:bifunctional tRNA (5-methylaminomethyl-2-thiouridine)(34)-methyltransferase MnmD/FAD-dependent 5-carboxymethylaminomethyl-2-thiouridine(34) oxidoreductase MnmC [Amphritea japonica]|uniref:tRNA 5-methylaminomethyl-2-thiouridine biosynthesis bifunctional protein MnmC n=1 Tax=Amphritea japonica ATCC BAA-1530 TaxID=1278309 RepID=A0A7R6SRG3_9GAMM|nr:bifunctional tRNA (5-methylaminomethyl-2-thiouridine)(34)-methyltransferase MnmD/FAD-dependent 5-carboxymethylaminomethyl-2-thiouridine(34) oxidoreductase MnmC [Amphritea japonica]BBB25214.1 tRNA 5-methylaminomethyl-2-thiouridine biosynthesis bifunctional protein [Amphritea japonica ATCC BAA-1530]